jgi:hypothetical protein
MGLLGLLLLLLLLLLRMWLQLVVPERWHEIVGEAAAAAITTDEGELEWHRRSAKPRVHLTHHHHTHIHIVHSNQHIPPPYWQVLPCTTHHDQCKWRRVRVFVLAGNSFGQVQAHRPALKKVAERLQAWFGGRYLVAGQFCACGICRSRYRGW